MERLINTNIHLTDLEKKALQLIRDEGSFYEESFNSAYSDIFLGYSLEESELKGARGALSSLVKKGVINIQEDPDFSDSSLVYINYILDFEDNGWTIKFPEEKAKEQKRLYQISSDSFIIDTCTRKKTAIKLARKIHNSKVINQDGETVWERKVR